ncbi:MAG: ArsR/SmtB family transcription factor [Fimbriimonadaceae bacterium]
MIALSALSQETRLDAFRILIEYGSEGLPAGQLGERLGVPHNTLSFHLSHLNQAGLVKSRKEGRTVIYSADCDVAKGLVDFLIANCCVRMESEGSCGVNLIKVGEIKK